METISVYHWANAGTYTCDRCTNMPRYTVELPEKPHDHCDCIIFEDEIVGEPTFRNAAWEDMGYSETGRVTLTVIRNTTEETKDYPVSYSTGNEVSVSVTIGSSLGVDVQGISAEISSSIESSHSTSSSVEVSDSVTLEPGEEALVKEITYMGTGIVIAEKYFTFKTNPLLDDQEIYAGIDQIGDGSYEFKGYEIEMP